MIFLYKVLLLDNNRAGHIYSILTCTINVIKSLLTRRSRRGMYKLYQQRVYFVVGESPIAGNFSIDAKPLSPPIIKQTFENDTLPHRKGRSAHVTARLTGSSLTKVNSPEGIESSVTSNYPIKPLFEFVLHRFSFFLSSPAIVGSTELSRWSRLIVVEVDSARHHLRQLSPFYRGEMDWFDSALIDSREKNVTWSWNRFVIVRSCTWRVIFLRHFALSLLSLSLKKGKIQSVAIFISFLFSLKIEINNVSIASYLCSLLVNSTVFNFSHI